MQAQDDPPARTGADAGAPGAGPLRSALIGAILAVDATGTGLALASICFAGALSAGLGLATGILLLSTAASTLVLAWKSGFRITLGISQDISIAIVAPAVALAATAAGGPMEAKVATGLAVMGLSAVLSGLVFWAVGRFGLGRLVRLFPYPVAAGFLASSGALLVLAAIGILTGAPGLAGLAAVLSPGAAQVNLALGAALAVCLVVAVKRWPGATPLLAVIFAFLAGFYLVLWTRGIGATEAVALGLLPDIGAGTGSVGPALSLFALIDWPEVIAVLPTLAAVVFLNLIGFLLNLTGVELATRDDVDANHELRITGLSNLAFGAAGGLTCFMQGGMSVLLAKLGAARLPMTAGHVAVLLLACVFAAEIVAAVPNFITAGLLMFVGLQMLDDWLVANRRQLSPGEWALVCGIVGLTLILGILTAIMAGLILAVLRFAVTYARLPVIRGATDAARRPSVVDRAAEEAEALRREGGRIRVLPLQGAVFFGSIDQLIEEATAPARRTAGLQALILDFTEVASLDSSACAGLDKLAFVMARRGVALHLAGLSPAFAATFARWGLPLVERGGASGAGLRVWRSLDEAVQACEEALLDEVLGEGRSHRVSDLLADLGEGDPGMADLLARLEPLDLAAGEVLIRSTGRSADVFILESGRLGIYLPGATGGAPIRLRVMAPGAIVGEVAHLLNLPRTADVVAETPARVWRMSEAAIAGLAAEAPALAALWSRILARSLAYKVVQTNRLLADSRRPG